MRVSLFGNTPPAQATGGKPANGEPVSKVEPDGTTSSTTSGSARAGAKTEDGVEISGSAKVQETRKTEERKVSGEATVTVKGKDGSASAQARATETTKPGKEPKRKIDWTIRGDYGVSDGYNVVGQVSQGPSRGTCASAGVESKDGSLGARVEHCEQDGKHETGFIIAGKF
ncbi:MAG: hypothetical protein U0931_29855 [Vulcanimicrobiota bacterium]